MRPQIVSIDTSKPFGQLVWDYGERKYTEGIYVGSIYGLLVGILFTTLIWVKLNKR